MGWKKKLLCIAFVVVLVDADGGLAILEGATARFEGAAEFPYARLRLALDRAREAGRPRRDGAPLESHVLVRVGHFCFLHGLLQAAVVNDSVDQGEEQYEGRQDEQEYSHHIVAPGLAHRLPERRGVVIDYFGVVRLAATHVCGLDDLVRGAISR